MNFNQISGWSGKSRPLKTNGTGECLAYYTESTKQTNMYGNKSVSSPDVRSFYCQPSSATSYRGSAMSVVMIHCRRSYYKEKWMIVVAEDLVLSTADRMSLVALRFAWCHQLVDLLLHDITNTCLEVETVLCHFKQCVMKIQQ